MNLLSDQEIESLKEVHPKKKILRTIFLVLGLVFVLIGFLFIILGFDFNIIILDLNFSLVIDIIIILIGMIITSKYFIASYYLRENSIVFKRMRNMRETIDKHIKFNSFAFTRLAAAILLTVAGLLSLLVFGTDIGHEVPYGSAVFLGGPSWFYVTGLPALGFGLGLLLYCFLSLFRGIFSHSKNFYFFYEVRPGFPWLTEVPKKDIEAIRYQNNHLGPKLMWIPAFFPFIVMQLMTAIPLFGAERAAPEYVLSWVFVIISIIEIIALLILVCFQQNYFEIATESRVYEMWFSPIKFKKLSLFKENFSEFLECDVDVRKDEKTNVGIFQNLNNKHFQMFNLVFGLILVVLSLIMLINMVFFGQLVWWLALIYGFILLLKAFSYDFSDKNGDNFVYSDKSKEFSFRRVFQYKFHYVSARNVEEISTKKWFRKLDAFDIIFISGLLIFMIFQQGYGWGLADSITLIFDNIFSTIILIIITTCIFYYLCFPIDVIEFKTTTIKYRIPVTIKLKYKNIFDKYVKGFAMFLKNNQEKDVKRTFFMRLGAMSLIIVGVVSYVLIFFLFFF
ncbi:MAG: hypothetical protein ACTSWH_02265 [Promethearchaeota archaeon]